ncbi:glycosyltransferase family 2 protein, partial [Enterococcus faecium]
KFLYIMRNRIFTKSRKLSMLLLLFSIHLYKFPVELRRKKLANNK